MRRAALAGLCISLVAAPAATAARFTFSVVTSSPLTAPGAILDGDDQTASFVVVTRVRYTGGRNREGWRVAAAATAPTSGATTLPALQVTAGDFDCVRGCATDPLPAGVTYPIVLSATAQTVYNAAADTGRGTFDVTSTLLITYPASALAGTYSSTLTLTGSTGP